MAKSKAAAKKHDAPSEAGELLGGVYEAGKHYGKKNRAQFDADVAAGKISPDALQRLANAGVLKGYGTSAAEAKKAQKAAESASETEE